MSGRWRPVLVAVALSVAGTAAGEVMRPNSDFTRGDSIPKDAPHDWNLGPTGLRGWMYCDKLVTTDARQIAITAVEGLAGRRRARGRRCRARGRGQGVRLRSPHGTGPGHHRGGDGGGRRSAHADALARGTDQRGRGEAAGAGHLQRDRALRLSQVEADPGARPARARGAHGGCRVRQAAGSDPSFAQRARAAGGRRSGTTCRWSNGGAVGGGVLRQGVQDLVLRLRDDLPGRIPGRDGRRVGAAPACGGSRWRRRRGRARSVRGDTTSPGPMVA
jgi:hypothetical protein